MVQLEEYPTITHDSEMDLFASREYFGTGSAIHGIRHMKMDSGKTLVYLEGQRDGQELVETSFGFQHKLVRYNVICGYLRRRLFGMLKRVEIIPSDSTDRVREEFLGKLKPDGFGRMPDDVDFWNGADEDI